MTTELEQLEQKNVLDLAEKYKQEGYQVFVKLSGSNLHEIISDEHIDLIIHGQENALIVAVKARESQSKAKSLIATPKNLPFKRPQLYDYPRRDSYDIQVYLTRALELIEIIAPDSALRLTAFTALAVMRMVAEQNDIDFEPQMPTELAHTFLERGLISQEDYEVLVTGLDLRDRMIFNQEKLTIDPKLAYHMVEVVQRIFSQVKEDV